MNTKSYFFTIILLLSLSGCIKKCKKSCSTEKKQTITKSMANETETVALVEVDTDESMSQNADENLLFSFYQEDEQGLEFSRLEDDYALEVADNASDELDENYLTYAWDMDEQNELKTIYFGFNKKEVSKDQQETLSYDIDQAIELLAQAQAEGIDAKIVVSGNSCSSAGTDEYNKSLSAERAQVVAKELKAAGIPEDKIQVIAKGSKSPAKIDGQEVKGGRDDQWLNRRVDLDVIYL